MDTHTITRVIVESLPSRDIGWVDTLSALLTPLIAIIAVYVAYQQYKTQQLNGYARPSPLKTAYVY